MRLLHVVVCWPGWVFVLAGSLFMMLRLNLQVLRVVLVIRQTCDGYWLLGTLIIMILRS